MELNNSNRSANTVKKYRAILSLGGRAFRLWCIGRCNFLFLCFLALSLAAVTVEAQTITEIRIKGNKRVEEQTIFSYIHSGKGLVFNEDLISQDVRTLYNTGYFETISVRKVPSGSGVALEFLLKERPAIKGVKIKGNEQVKETELKEKLNVGSRRFLDRRKIRAGIESALQYYHSEGYLGTQIDYEVQPVETAGSENQVDLVFTVKEGDKRVVRSIVFEGAKELDEDELSGVIASKPYSWWISWLTSRGDYIEEQLKQDSKILTHLYLTKGFVDVQVSDPITEEVEDGVRIIFKIREGDIFKFGKQDAEGSLVGGSSEKTLEGIVAKEGEVFNVDLVRDSTQVIADKFSDVGYAFVNVEPLTSIDRSDRRVDLKYQVDRGEKVNVNRIKISGNQKTRDNVVRRTLKIQEQETFSSSKIKRSQELLTRLGFFEEVTITPQKTATPQEVDLLINVREASTGSFSIGAGISSGDGVLFSSQISESNLMGTGNTLAFDVNVGSERDRYTLSFLNPRVDDSYWSFRSRLQAASWEYDDFDKAQQGGLVGVGHPLWFLSEEDRDDVNVNLAYELLNIEIDNIDPTASQIVKDEEGESISSSIIPSIVRSTINNPIDPSEGSRQNVSTQFAGLGGDEEFWVVDVSNSWYYPLWNSPLGKFVFSQRSSIGYGEAINDDAFPLFKRYFPGGINSVRGYEARSMGPKDETGDSYGGSKEVVLNFELIGPLAESVGLKWLVFYDMGEAFDDDDNIDLGSLRSAYGFGLRWRTPLAPIRIEFGLPLDKEDGDKSFVTNFSLGAPL